MNFLEFCNELRTLPADKYQLYLDDDSGAFRFINNTPYGTPFCLCPLTAVVHYRYNRYLTSDQYLEAARQLGLTEELTHSIVHAVDSVEGNSGIREMIWEVLLEQHGV